MINILLNFHLHAMYKMSWKCTSRQICPVCREYRAIRLL